MATATINQTLPFISQTVRGNVDNFCLFLREDGGYILREDGSKLAREEICADNPGYISQTLPAITQILSAAFTATFSGTATQTLPALTQSATGTYDRVFRATLTQTLAPLTQSATGTHQKSYLGSVDQTLFPITQSLTGITTAPGFTGTISQTLPFIEQHAEWTVPVPITEDFIYNVEPVDFIYHVEDPEFVYVVKFGD